MIKGVANVWMPVEDVERAKGFYRDTLELPVVKDEGEWVEFDANGMRVALNGREPGEHTPKVDPCSPSSPNMD